MQQAKVSRRFSIAQAVDRFCQKSEDDYMVSRSVWNQRPCDAAWSHENSNCLTHRIHGAAIYGNMDPINIPPMLVYIAYMDPMGYTKGGRVDCAGISGMPCMVDVGTCGHWIAPVGNLTGQWHKKHHSFFEDGWTWRFQLLEGASNQTCP